MDNMKISWLNEWFNQSEKNVEFRLIGAKGFNEQLFIAVEDANDTLLEGLIEKEKEEQLIVYYVVITCEIKLNKEAAVLHVLDLWLEIDSKHATYEEAMQIVNSLPTPPTATVVSENGIQAYIKFNEPCGVMGDDPFKFIKDLSLKLYTSTKADNIANLVRLLRVPNSVNVKKLVDAKLCSLLEYTGATYSLDRSTYLDDVQEVNEAVATIEVNKVGEISTVHPFANPEITGGAH
ncbi:hypothetical protein C518_3004 [Lysinibacillus fusiformis ZB2]|nr:hypothetical protein C518_3004 [Lysinibacillus fusiformis ZB2]